MLHAFVLLHAFASASSPAEQQSLQGAKRVF
jgi:hypothetical protein